MTRHASEHSSATNSPKSRPTTRSSLRQSLGLAGKALADVINKDNKDADKSAKKGKEASSRRLSAIGLNPAASRTSMDAKSPPLQPARSRTPDSKTITRRRMSAGFPAASQEDLSAKPGENANMGGTRGSTLRPRSHLGSSALPKYRPKSAVGEKPPSPKTGARRPFTSSEDEREERNKPPEKTENCSPLEKVSRPISPLPHRIALKISTAVNTRATPPSTPPPTKSVVLACSKSSSPQRPTKLVKTTASTSVPATSAIPRPSSSASNSSSLTQHTPKTPQLKNVSVIRRSAQASPSPRSASVNDSPLSRISRIKTNGRSSPSMPAGNMSHISEADSEDSEAEDVALLLAPVAVLGAPTPAMPRITRKRPPPKTPTRNFLPSRENMSYLSPLPPDTESSGRSSLRPPRPNGGAKQARGSILSWEQLASEASKTLGEGELENMLADMPAPFPPGLVSPTPSVIQLEVPESPCLSALNSPGGYGSISQVLLPDVTPSPALHHSSRYDVTADGSGVDSATLTLVRLQLAAAETLAKERLSQMQKMEEEMHNLKTLRSREAQELMKQVTHMEEQFHGSLKVREQADEERLTYIAELKVQLRQAHKSREQAVQEAIARSRREAEVIQDAALDSQRRASEVECSTRVAQTEWESVRSLAELELDLVRGDRQVLAVLLEELNALSETVR